MCSVGWINNYKLRQISFEKLSGGARGANSDTTTNGLLLCDPMYAKSMQTVIIVTPIRLGFFGLTHNKTLKFIGM